MNGVITTQTAEQQVGITVADATAVVIKSEVDNQAVANKIVAAREMKKQIEEHILKGARETKRQATKALSDLEAKFLKPLDQALEIYRDKSAAYVMAENRRREAIQAKHDAKFEKQAERAAETGKPMTAAPVVVARVQTTGVKYSTYYRAEVKDIRALCGAVASGALDAVAVEANLPFLNGLARAHKANGKEIAPGVVCIEEKRVG
ncbi:hypothetical protein CCP3SC1AL1_110025 [Gammaproteobacteria bacterium]